MHAHPRDSLVSFYVIFYFVFFLFYRVGIVTVSSSFTLGLAVHHEHCVYITWQLGLVAYMYAITEFLKGYTGICNACPQLNAFFFFFLLCLGLLPYGDYIMLSTSSYESRGTGICLVVVCPM